MRSTKRTRALAAIAALTVGAFALAGCASSAAPENNEGTGTAANTPDVNFHTASGQVNEELRALLPDSITSAGKLVVATDATIGEPFASYDTDNTTIVGIVPDLAYLMGDTLGVDVELRQVVFANLIPGLQANRYDFSLAPMLNTEERRKQVDFIDFLHGGSAFIIAKEGSESTNLSVDDVCGMKIGFTTGSVEEITMTERSEQCVAEGKAPVGLLSYKTNNEGVLALVSDRIQAYATAAAQAGYIAKGDSKQLAMSGEPFKGGLSGMAFSQDSDVYPAIQATLQALIDNGKYEKVLASYGVEHLAVESAG